MPTKKPDVEMRPVVPDPVKPLDPEIDLPTGFGVLLMPVGKLGWSVLSVEVQGKKVLALDVLYGPVPKADAMQRLLIESRNYTLVRAVKP